MKKSSLIILYLIWFVGFVVANTVVHTTRYRFLEIDYGPKYNRKFSNNLIDWMPLWNIQNSFLYFHVFSFIPCHTNTCLVSCCLILLCYATKHFVLVFRIHVWAFVVYSLISISNIQNMDFHVLCSSTASSAA